MLALVGSVEGMRVYVLVNGLYEQLSIAWIGLLPALCLTGKWATRSQSENVVEEESFKFYQLIIVSV